MKPFVMEATSPPIQHQSLPARRHVRRTTTVGQLLLYASIIINLQSSWEGFQREYLDISVACA